ncbi:MAG: GNAT family N-acetyltransferase [Candidatus Peribacteraceae bacterium]|nr:GNAT family N-acetyltransferase [Candidatus Peribacteraceae bacterium]MDD5742416.1 GNAT family N-acetyltransferase [Candidatus Peribacteraceae bacterium]
MVRELTAADRQAILDLAYRRERENLFLIGNTESPAAFSDNRYFGSFDGLTLRAVAAWFGRWGSFVATGEAADIPSIVDAALDAKVHIESVPAVQPYADLIVMRLKEQGLIPRVQHVSLFLELKRQVFHPFGSAARRAREEDRDALVLLQRDLHDRTGDIPITALERSRITLERAFVVEEDGHIAATATAGVDSRRFTQVVGVITDARFRRRGYAAGCMSALCAQSFVEGKDAVVLFTEAKNTAAQALYAKLGFTVIGDFLLAEYPI